MKKLSLEDLVVDSFITSASEVVLGTVQAHQDTQYPCTPIIEGIGESEAPNHSCQDTCAYCKDTGGFMQTGGFNRACTGGCTENMGCSDGWDCTGEGCPLNES